MADVPIPTIAEAGQGVAWFNSQAGLVSTVLAIFCVAFAATLFFAVRYFGRQLEAAWVRVTAISEARSADSRAGDDAINKNTLALTILNERLNNRT